MSGPPTRIRVATAAPYDVIVGDGVLGEVPAMLGKEVRRVAVIHPPGLPEATDTIAALLDRAGYHVHPVQVPEGEAAKTAEVAAACWAELGRLGWTRSDAVLGLGGGATTDLAGFVAATFLRGIRVVHVPTSLLAMVDAAVGGKTGINTAEGKNLVGSFHEPAGVVCDLALLASLPRVELSSGLAEVIKCGLVADPAILDRVADKPQEALHAGSATLRELVERAVGVKARFVSRDLKEATSTGSAVGREALNYGHTLGHAIERVEGFRFRHGEAVAVGMVFAAELGRLTGRLSVSDVQRHRDLLRAVGLPTTYPGERWPALHEAMRRDKKTRGDRLRFVVLEGIGRPAILESPDAAALVEAYGAIGQ
jgi:3-dehydroquinate synthase